MGIGSGLDEILWDHLKTGGRYRIKGFGINEATMIPEVAYQPENHPGALFFRPCSEFFDGRFVPVSRVTKAEFEQEKKHEEAVRAEIMGRVAKEAEAAGPYDPTKPLEPNWDALDPSYVEDCDGTALKLGDLVVLHEKSEANLREWVGAPTNAATVTEIENGKITLDDDDLGGSWNPAHLKFYRRPSPKRDKK